MRLDKSVSVLRSYLVNESQFCETSDDHGGLVSCLVFKSRLVSKSTGLPETLNDPSYT